MTFGERMRALMTERGISLRKLAKTIHYDVGYLSRVARDHRPPPEKMARAIDQALSANGELLALRTIPKPAVSRPMISRLLEQPAGHVRPTRPHSPGVSVDDVGNVNGRDDDVKRRAALQLFAALGAGTTVPPGVLEDVLSGIDDALGNPLDLDDWERTIHEYGQQIVTEPAGALVHDLTADIIAVGELLKRQHPGTPDHRGLLRVSAGLSGLLAIDLGDTGNRRAARTTWNTAAHAADASADTNLRVWVRGRAAQEACWAKRPLSVVNDLVDEAAVIAGDAPTDGLARAYAAQACAAADHGNMIRAQASLDALKRTFDKVVNDSAGQSALAYHETQFRWAQSYVFTLTGNGHAEATLTKALILYPPNAHKARVNLSLMRSILLIKEGDVNAGLEQASAALESAPGATSVGRFLLTRKVLEILPKHTRALPVAQDFRTLATGH